MSNTDLFLLGAGAAVVLLLVARRAGGAVVEAVNPADPDNIFYGGTNAVGDILNDGQDNGNFNLGSWLYDLMHPEERRPSVYDMTNQAEII